MKPGELYVIERNTTPLNGRLVYIIGENPMRPGTFYVKALCDRIRMFPIHWLKKIQ